MQSISLGWSFLQEAWLMALKDRALLKPSLLAVNASSEAGVLGIIALAGAAQTSAKGQAIQAPAAARLQAALTGD